MQIHNGRVKYLFDIHKPSVDRNINLLGKELDETLTKEQLGLVRDYALLAYQKGLLDADQAWADIGR